jgi:hypothetical protein
MAVKITASAAHNQICAAAELTRQSAVSAAGNSQSAVKAVLSNAVREFAI